MKLIALKNVFVEIERGAEIVFYVGEISHSIPFGSQETIFMQPGDILKFKATAFNDHPYQTLAETYPEYFRLEEEEHKS